MMDDRLYILGVCFSGQTSGVSIDQMLERLRNDPRSLRFIVMEPSVKYLQLVILTDAVSEGLVVEVGGHTGIYTLTTLGLRTLLNRQIESTRASLAKAVEDLARLACFAAQISQN